MQFISAENSAPTELNYFIQEIKLVTVYFVYKGRNAYHSTWIRRYSDGCLHASIESAKSYCETERTNGTVFTISRLPALAFTAGDKIFAVTEIEVRKNLNEFNFELLTWLTNLLPLPSLSFLHLYHLFKPKSTLWPKDHPKKNSVILVTGNFSKDLVACDEAVKFIEYESKPRGTGNRLGWPEKKLIPLDCSNMFALEDSLSSRLQNQKRFK